MVAVFSAANRIGKTDTQPRYKGPYLSGPRCELVRGEAGYPEMLFDLADAPQRLYVIGDVLALSAGLAVVGARKATPYGISCATRFAGLAAARGISIISGGARGCDAAAHRAALAAGGRTVAILGGGCDEIYPAVNFGLFQEIIDKGGAVISEQAWSFPPMRHTFRARNRLIAGLSLATLIVEAGLPSGTFSTADEALAANREVLVVPGSIMSLTSRGANRLIYQGATPIVDDDSFGDILFSLYGLLKQESLVSTEGSPENADRILCALRANPMSIDELLAVVSSEHLYRQCAETGDAMTYLMVRLTELERDGAAARYPDGRWGPLEKRA